MMIYFLIWHNWSCWIMITTSSVEYCFDSLDQVGPRRWGRGVTGVRECFSICSALRSLVLYYFFRFAIRGFYMSCDTKLWDYAWLRRDRRKISVESYFGSNEVRGSASSLERYRKWVTYDSKKYYFHFMRLTRLVYIWNLLTNQCFGINLSHKRTWPFQNRWRHILNALNIHIYK